MCCIQNRYLRTDVLIYKVKHSVMVARPFVVHVYLCFERVSMADMIDKGTFIV